MVVVVVIVVVVVAVVAVADYTYCLKVVVSTTITTPKNFK